MILYGELKQFKSKALVSGDKGIELKIYIIANNINTNGLQDLLLKPLKVELAEDAQNNNNSSQDTGL